MGTSSCKQVQAQLQKQYKPVRKYYDQFYGEVTILQNQNSKQIVAKTETTLQPNKNITKYIDNRIKNKNESLIEILAVSSFPIDICSGNQMHVFLLQYYSLTLFDQILNRQAKGTPFLKRELIILYHSIVHAFKTSKQLGTEWKLTISNSNWLYLGNGKVKILEDIFCAKNQLKQLQDLQSIYVSPESFAYWARQEKMRAKQLAFQQSSIVFTLGMNFLEIALLSDLTDMYDKYQGTFDCDKFNQALNLTLEEYGEQIHKLIKKMTEIQPSKRPTMDDVDEYLQYLIKIPSRVRTSQTNDSESF